MKIQNYTKLCVCGKRRLTDVISRVTVRHVQTSNPCYLRWYVRSTHPPRWHIQTHLRKILKYVTVLTYYYVKSLPQGNQFTVYWWLKLKMETLLRTNYIRTSLKKPLSPHTYHLRRDPYIITNSVTFRFTSIWL